jgi:rod shape-determining protein MreD
VIYRGLLYYLMVPLLLLAALLQSTAANRLEIGGVKPDLVLLLIISGSLIYGSRPSVVWAFVGGLCLDVFSGGPLGSSSLALMSAAVVAGIGHRTLSRYNLLVPIGITLLGSFAYSVTYMGILALLNALQVVRHSLPLVSTVQYIVLPAALYNAILMVCVMPFLNRQPESQDI